MISEEIKEIYKKVLEIQELYYKAYSQGDYLSICIMIDYIAFNNEHWGVDSEYPVSIMRFKGEPLDD